MVVMTTTTVPPWTNRIAPAGRLSHRAHTAMVKPISPSAAYVARTAMRAFRSLACARMRATMEYTTATAIAVPDGAEEIIPELLSGQVPTGQPRRLQNLHRDDCQQDVHHPARDLVYALRPDDQQRQVSAIYPTQANADEREHGPSEVVRTPREVSPYLQYHDEQPGAYQCSPKDREKRERIPELSVPLAVGANEVVAGGGAHHYPNHDQHAEQQVRKVYQGADVEAERKETDDGPYQYTRRAIPDQRRPDGCEETAGCIHGQKALIAAPALSYRFRRIVLLDWGAASRAKRHVFVNFAVTAYACGQDALMAASTLNRLLGRIALLDWGAASRAKRCVFFDFAATACAVTAHSYHLTTFPFRWLVHLVVAAKRLSSRIGAAENPHTISVLPRLTASLSGESPWAARRRASGLGARSRPGGRWEVAVSHLHQKRRARFREYFQA